MERTISLDYLTPINCLNESPTIKSSRENMENEIIIQRPNIGNRGNEYEGIYSELNDEQKYEIPLRNNAVNAENRYSKRPLPDVRISRRPFVKYGNKTKSVSSKQKDTVRFLYLTIFLLVAIIIAGGCILTWKLLACNAVEIAVISTELPESNTEKIASSQTEVFSTTVVTPADDVKQTTFEADLPTEATTTTLADDVKQTTSETDLPTEATTTTTAEESSTVAIEEVALYNTTPRLFIPVLNPVGVAVDGDTGDIYIALLRSNQLCRYDGQGGLVWCSIGSGNNLLRNPRGVATRKNSAGIMRIYVTDEHHVNVFDSAGTFLRKWGNDVASDQQGHFNVPCTMAFDDKGLIHVSDYHNHRIQVFDQLMSVKYVHNIQGQDVLSNQPTGIAINQRNGLKYVIYHGKVNVFDSSWQYLSNIASASPYSVAVDSESNIIITDNDCQCIKIFSNDNVQIQQFGKEGECQECLNYASDLAVNDNNGELIVSDNANNRVLVFRRL